jgi:crossover junction endodeoxyribonuclease RuvC
MPPDKGLSKTVRRIGTHLDTGRMFVLGIDPGLSRCGYGLVTRDGSTLRARAAGVLETDPHDELPHRLLILETELRGLVEELRPDVVAVERVFFQVNAKTAMSVGQASGLALVVAEAAGCEVAQYTANEVKQALVGYGAATKEQIQRMVAQVLGLKAVDGPPDVADALALAVCHLTTVPLRRAVDAALDHPSGGGRRALGGTVKDEFSNVRSLR